MKINTSHLVGAAIALAAVFFSKLDAQDAPAKWEHQKWEYDLITFDKEITPQIYINAINRNAWLGHELVTIVTDTSGKSHHIYRKPVEK